MESNIIYKIFLRESALNQASQSYDAPIKNIFEKINPFQLFNILGKNNLFIFGIVLLVLYSWFIRANISLGAIFGFLFLGFIFYLFYQKLSLPKSDWPEKVFFRFFFQKMKKFEEMNAHA